MQKTESITTELPTIFNAITKHNTIEFMARIKVVLMI